MSWTHRSFFSLCSAYASARLPWFQTLLCLVLQPAMSSIIHPQAVKGRYSSSPVLFLFLPLGSTCLAWLRLQLMWLPCSWCTYPSIQFPTSGKIPMNCQCFWTCWVGLEAPDPARLWQRQTGLGPGLVTQLLLHPRS